MLQHIFGDGMFTFGHAEDRLPNLSGDAGVLWFS